MTIDAAVVLAAAALTLLLPLTGPAGGCRSRPAPGLAEEAAAEYSTGEPRSTQ